MSRSHLILTAVLVLVCGDVGLVRAGEPVRIPGTKVSLEAPDGFELAANFDGFFDEQRASSIAVSEVPTSVEEMASGMSSEALAAGGMTLLQTEPAKVGGRDGQLLRVTQKANGAEFEKWLALVGDSSTTIMIVATYPKALSQALRDELRAAVTSAVWRPELEIGLLDGLPFRIEESERLKVQRRMQSTLLLTRENAPAVLSPSEPLLVVGNSISPVAIEDLESFSKARVAQTAELVGLENIEGQKIELAGLSAYELTASAKDEQTGTPVTVYQAIAAEGDTYYLVQGIISAESADDYLAEFKQVARSLKLQ